eukprot:1181884-Prorocentrum_minimum.AAC.2
MRIEPGRTDEVNTLPRVGKHERGDPGGSGLAESIHQSGDTHVFEMWVGTVVLAVVQCQQPSFHSTGLVRIDQLGVWEKGR